MDNQPLPNPLIPPKAESDNVPQVPPKPVIYTGNKPNFEQQKEELKNKRMRLLKRLVELDILLHIFIGALAVLFLAGIAISSVRSLFPGLNSAHTQASLINTIKVAQGTGKSPIFINQQEISIDKAFNSEPTQIKLTINGQLKKEVLGFLPNWAVDHMDEIDTRLLTAVSYFGLEIGPDGNIVENNPDPVQNDAWYKWQNDPNLIKGIRTLKRNRIKVFLTLKAFNQDTIERLVRSEQASQAFINNALYQMSAKSLDGINIDFEYVGTPPADVRDKFSILMSNLNQALKRQYPKSELTIDTFAQSAVQNDLFDLPLLANNCDYLVMMGYDFHTPQSDNSGPIAPYEGSSLSILSMVDAYLEKIPAEKLILAVPYYGYDWPTTSADKDAKVVSNGDVKVLTYAEIASATRKININWDDETQTPWYSYVDPQTHQTRVVHFENTRSLGIKYDLINNKGLAGVGIWALGMDGRNTELEQLLADKFANQ